MNTENTTKSKVGVRNTSCVLFYYLSLNTNPKIDYVSLSLNNTLYVLMCDCVVCMCVCVRERESERELTVIVLCVCVCV